MNRPIALVCYICGREEFCNSFRFGTKSLGIHIKSCEKKWENEESMKPPKQRRPCPRAPPGLTELLAKPNITRQDVDSFNHGSFNTFKDEALMECEYCQRKFNPKSLIPHQKACKTNPMIRKPPKGSSTIEEKSEDSPKIDIPSKGYKIPNNAVKKYLFEDEGENLELVSCGKCNRKFAPDRVDKHQNVCKGVEVKISEKENVKEIAKPKQNLTKKENENSDKTAKWKAQSNDLQNAMKEMRKLKAFQEKGGNLKDLPPPPKGNYDHYVDCKYCGRKYAPDVAERHIPKCANIVNKPGGIKPSKIQEKYIGGTGSGASKLASPKVTSSKTGITKPLISSIQSNSVKSVLKPQMIAKGVKM